MHSKQLASFLSNTSDNFVYSFFSKGTVMCVIYVKVDSIFQFQYGTIKSKFSLMGGRIEDDFNSNMVRLKALVLNSNGNRLEFQFQYGTIKRKWLLQKGMKILFQFQYGTIKR